MHSLKFRFLKFFRIHLINNKDHIFKYLDIFFYSIKDVFYYDKFFSNDNQPVFPESSISYYSIGIQFIQIMKRFNKSYYSYS